MRFADEIAKLIEQALARLRLPAGQLAGQLAGTQVAPAASGSPGVVDRDDLVVLSDATPEPLGAADAGDADDASRSDHVHAHGNQAGGTLHSAATSGAAGFMSASDKSKLDAIEALADVTDAGNVGSAIHGATAKTTPVDADETALIDSAASNALKRLTWANLKAALKTYFDTLYTAVGGAVTSVSGTAPISSSGGTTPAISISAATSGAAGSMSASDKSKLDGIEALADVTDADNVGTAIHGATGKTTPVDADETALIDSAASNVLKKLTWANLKATLKTYFDTLYATLSHTHTWQSSGARVYNSANLSINSGSNTRITFNSERWDTDSYHDTGSNTGRLTIPSAGRYLINGQVRFAANATGYRSLLIYLNNTTELAYMQTPAIAGGVAVTIIEVSTMYEFASGDYIELYAFQNSGGALNVEAAGNYSPEFMIARL